MRYILRITIVALVYISCLSCSVNKRAIKQSYIMISPLFECVYSSESLSGYREIFAFCDDYGNTYLVRVKARKANSHILNKITQVQIGCSYTLSLTTTNKPIKIKPDMVLFGRIDDEWSINPTASKKGPVLTVRNGKMYGAYTSPDLVNIEGVLYIRKGFAKHE